jgi:hypothetical protein
MVETVEIAHWLTVPGDFSPSFFRVQVDVWASIEGAPTDVVIFWGRDGGMVCVEWFGDEED